MPRLNTLKYFVSYPADSSEGDPVGLSELRPRQFGLDEVAQGRDRKAVPAGVAHAERLEFAERFPEQPCCGVRLLHPQPQIRGRDLDAGAQQNALAAAHTASRISCDSQK
jgi:hypothetical protein